MNKDGDQEFKPIKWGPFGVTYAPECVRSIQCVGRRADGTVVGPVTLFDRDTNPPRMEPDRPEPDRP